MMKKYILILLAVLPLILFSQNKSHLKQKDEEKDEEPYAKVDMGLTFGTYFANSYSANYYNGSESNVNKISYVFSNQYWRDEIRQDLDASGFYVKQLPQDMHYNITLTGGLFLRVNMNRNNSIFLEGTYVKLKADDVFTLEVSPQNYTFPDLRVFGIHGVEERVNIDLGFERRFPVYRNKMNIFADAGANINYVQVLESYINIYEKEYSLINVYDPASGYVPGAYSQEIENIQSGFGFGFLLAGGVGFTFSPRVGMQIGGKMIYSNVALEGYDAYRPSGTAFVRFTFAVSAVDD